MPSRIAWFNNYDNACISKKTRQGTMKEEIQGTRPMISMEETPMFGDTAKGETAAPCCNSGHQYQGKTPK